MTEFKKNILKILYNLQHRCEIAEINKFNTKKGIPFYIKDIAPPITGQEYLEDLQTTFQYLKNNGLDISITLDFERNLAEVVQNDGYLDEDSVEVGLIKGDNIQDIQTKIKELINMLSSERSVPIVKDTLTEEDKPSDRILPLSENGIGYLIFYGEKIPIGEISTGKFKLVETLCGMGLRKGKTIDTVFDYIKVEKDKNKIDASLGSPYLARNRKLVLIENQMREVNRAITEYVEKRKLKKLKFRLKIKKENDTIWMENKVGRRG
mgnify:FL=1